MKIAKGDFIKINYVGKIKENQFVFDTTYEEVAKKSGMYSEKIKFKPLPIVVGASHVLKGIDEVLIGMEVGEKKTIEVQPEKAYGIRDVSKIKTFSLKDFTKEKINPYPGMRVEVENTVGKVLAVGGGRVTIDLNHELAGKALEYEISIEERVNKTEEKIRYLLELHFSYANPNEHEIKIENSTAKITIAESAKFNSALGISKIFTSRDIFQFIDSVENVEFTEVYKKEKKEAEKKEEKKEEKKKEEKEGHQKKLPQTEKKQEKEASK